MSSDFKFDCPFFLKLTIKIPRKWILLANTLSNKSPFKTKNSSDCNEVQVFRFLKSNNQKVSLLPQVSANVSLLKIKTGIRKLHSYHKYMQVCVTMLIIKKIRIPWNYFSSVNTKLKQMEK